MVTTSQEIQNVQETQIAPYAPPRAEIREMVERFKAGLTNADKLNQNELMALATAALGHSLNPWNHELWALPGKGLMLGIKGLRKVADRQAEKGSFRWWTEFLDIRSPAEAELYDVPKGAIAAKLCILRRSDNIAAYLDNLKNLQGAGLEYEDAKQLIGAPPRTIGVGFVMPNEKSEMPIPQRVMKRAEAHAIKQAFSVPFRSEYNVDLEPIEPDGGAWSVTPTEPQIIEGSVGGEVTDGNGDYEAATRVVENELNRMADDVVTEMREPKRPYSPLTLQLKIAKSLEAHLNADPEKRALLDKDAARKLAIMMGNVLKGVAGKETERHALLNFFFGVESSLDVTIAERDVLESWLTKDAPMAREEAAMVLDWLTNSAVAGEAEAEAAK